MALRCTATHFRQTYGTRGYMDELNWVEAMALMCTPDYFSIISNNNSVRGRFVTLVRRVQGPMVAAKRLSYTHILEGCGSFS